MVTSYTEASELLQLPRGGRTETEIYRTKKV